MLRLLVFVFSLNLLPGEASGVAQCKVESSRVRKLTEETNFIREQLTVVQAKLKNVSGEESCTEEQEFSVLAVLSKTGSIALSVSEHFLQQTTIDEQLVTAVSRAKAHATSFKNQVTSMDYKGYVNNLKAHPGYLAHVAPHVSTVSDLLAPHLDTVQMHLTPVYQAAQTHYATVTAAMQNSLFPSLWHHSSQAFDAASSGAEKLTHLDDKLGDLLDPFFKATATAAPEQSKFLPNNSVDRLLFLVGLLIFTFFLAKMFTRTAVVVGKNSCVMLRFALWMPLRLIGWFVGVFIFVITGFYCCGVCRRKKAVAVVDKAKSSITKQAENVDVKTVTEATLAEVIQILEESKKEGSLPARSKKLAAVVKSGKPSNGIKAIEGKTLAKETLKKALGKFKEINTKDLGL